MAQCYGSERVTNMCNSISLFIFYFCGLLTTAFTQVVDGENVSPAEASVLPYSLKATVGNDNGGRYKLLTVNPANNQAVESELVEQHNMNPQNRRGDVPWDRISANYKTQLSAVKQPINELGYYNAYDVAPHTLHTDINNFGTVAGSLPLSLLLILNLGMLLYLYVHTMSVFSAAAVGTNIRLPYNIHEYLRRDEYDNKYN